MKTWCKMMLNQMLTHYKWHHPTNGKYPVMRNDEKIMENPLELAAPHWQTNPVIVRNGNGNGKKWQDMAAESPDAGGTGIRRIQRKRSENGVCIH